MKKMLIILSAFIILIIAFMVYWNNDGWLAYKIQKVKLTPLELINYYTSIPFPATVKVESIDFGKDTPGSNDEYLEATLLIPSDEIANLFNEKIRDYDSSNALLFKDEEKEYIYFSSNMYNTVRKLLDKTQRTIHFTVLKSNNEYTKVYVLIDKLGWYLWNKQQLGGE